MFKPKFIQTLILLSVIGKSISRCSHSIAIVNAGSSVLEAPAILRKSAILFSAIVKSNDCPRLSGYDYEWRLYEGYFNLKRFKLRGEVEINRNYIKIPGKYLPYSNYTVEITVVTTNQTVVKKGYFRIIASNLVPIIEGGTRRSVFIGDKCVMNATRSHDPDYFPKEQKLKFSWTCKSKPSTLFCKFGNPVSKRPYFFIPRLILRKGVIYTFDLKISTFNRARKPKTVQQIITPSTASKNILSIRCVKNCATKVVTLKSLELEAFCLRCPVNVTYQWSFESNARNIKTTLDWDTDTLYGRFDKVLSVKSETFYPGEIYEFSVTIIGLERVLPAFYQVRVKLGPQSGKCTLVPSNGIAVALRTNVSVTCNGFVTDTPPLTYSFYYNWNYTDINIHLSKKLSNMSDFTRGVLLRKRVFPHALNLVLPPGDPLRNFDAAIIVSVRDASSMYTDLILNLNVKPPRDFTPEALKAFIQSETGTDAGLNDMLAMGNIEGLLTDVMAIGHYINHELVEYKRPVMSLKEYSDIRQSLIDSVWKLPIYSVELAMQAASAVQATIEGGKIESTIITLETSGKVMSKVANVLISEAECPELSFLRILEAASTTIRALSTLFNASVENDPLQITTIDTDDFYNDMQYDTYEEYTDEHWEDLEIMRRKSVVAVTCVRLMDTISKMVLNRSRTDEGKRLLETKCVRIWLEKSKSGRTGEHDMGCNRGSRIHLPDPKDLGLINKDDILNTMLLETKKNPYFFQKSSDQVNSNFLLVEVAGKDLNSLDFKSRKTDFEYLVERRVNLMTEPPVDGYLLLNNTENVVQADITIHRIVVSHNASNILLVFGNISTEHVFVVTLKYNYAPTVADFKQFNMITNFNTTENVSRVLFPSNRTKDGPGFYYLGILPFTRKVAMVLGIQNASGVIESKGSQQQFGITYTLSTHQLRCLYWNDKQSEWMSDGCRLGYRTREYLIHCKCTHLSAFSAGFLVAPNYLDLSATLELFKTVPDNPVVLGAVLAIWSLYFLMLIWAIRKDRRLRTKNIVNILAENVEGDSSRYLVTVSTGCRKGSGTTSRVYIQLFGEMGQSSPRCLNPNLSSKLLQKGDDDMFLLTTDSPLGELRKISVWHRNDRGVHPKWFLSRIHVIDLTSRRSWYFHIGQWLSLGRDLSRDAVPFKGDNSFLLSFNARAVSSLRDGHLWFSILLPPPRNRFGCKQRLSVALCLLLMAMLVNIMFYGTNVNDPEDQVRLHRLQISMSQIVVGMESAFIVFPVGFLLCFLFQHSKPRDGQRLIFQRMVEDHESEEEVSSTTIEGSESSVSSAGGKGCCQLPWWFVYVAYFMAYSLAILASYFVILYGLTYGYDRSLAWLISMFTSFAQSVIIIQPVKVFVMAFIVTLVLEKPPNRYGDLEKYFAQSEPVPRELSKGGIVTKPNRESTYSKLSPTVVKEYRYFHGTEKKIVFIISEMAIFALFFAALLVIIYSQFPSVAYFGTKSIRNMIFDSTLNKVKDFDSCVKYLNDVLIPNLHANQLWNGQPLNKVGYMVDLSTRLVGVPRLRQKRVINESCSTHLGNHLVGNCAKPYAYWREDKGDYFTGWSQNPPLESPKLIGRKSGIDRYDPWVYRSGNELDNVHFDHGQFGIYGGGGYVALLGRTRRWSREALNDLLTRHWLDDRSRVLLVEFTTYNANSNLFSIVQVMLELTAFGYVKPSYKIETARFHYVRVGLDTVVGFAHVLFIALLVLMTVRELLRMKEFGLKQYMKDAWNVLELGLILTSISAIGVTLKRYQAVSMAFEANNPATGNKFVNFYPAARWNSVLSSLQGFIIASSAIKIFKLMSFNRYFAFPYETLRASTGVLVHHFVFMVIPLIGGALYCRLAFGLEMSNFRTFTESLVTILKILMGRVSFQNVVDTGSFYRGVFFIFYVFFIIFIMMSLFYAILRECMKRARERLTSCGERGNPRTEDIVDYLKYQMKVAVGKKDVSWVQHQRFKKKLRN